MEKVLKYTENEVNFDSVKIPQILYEHGPLGRKGKIEYNDDEVTHINSKPFINAVDIDWNGIEIENNNRINTTADLINWIKSRSTGSSGGSLSETISVPITCYRWYHIDAEPHVPTENSKEPESTDSFDAIPESNWSKYALNRPEGNDWVLYLCSGTKEGKSYLWESVTRISGIDGSVGEDSKDREWIYKVFNEEKTFSFDNYNPNNWDAVQQDDYVGPNGWLWSDNPQGVSKENRFEYASYRDYKNKLWTRFSTPILWSHYGVNGIDGDGVEYCYVRTVSKEAPEVVVNNIENELTDEYKPLVKIESLAGYNNTKLDIKGEGEYYQNDGYSYTRCTDDPKGVDGTFQYEWVIVRKKDEPNDNGTRKWKRYSGQMSLWSSFTVNVDPAITIKDGYLWGDGDYIRDGDGNPIKIEGGDGSQGVETIGCPDENKTYKPGTISVCENKVKIYYNDQWIDFGEGSGSGKYIHIAYAKSIDFVNETYTGFSKTNSNDGTIYDWMGIMFDDNINDSDVTSWEEFMQYKWNYIRGRDGNGVEYVFLLTKEEVTNPGINEAAYNGHNNQDDEFFPQVTNYDLLKHQSSTWTDDPQQGVSEEWPKLWKAIRKKVNGVWQNFGNPKIENQYFAQTSIYVITSDNDNILLDDLSTSENIIKVAAAGNLELKYGTQTVEVDKVLYEIVDNDHNLPNNLVPIINGNSFNLEYKAGTTAPDKFNTGQYHFTIGAKLNANDSSYVALKQFNVIIKDISVDGSFYKLVIENDSLSYDGNKNSYNNNAPIIHVLKIGIKDNEISISEETNISITTEIIDPENPGNLPDGLILYIPESLFTVESSKKYDSPIELDNVTYQKGGYDIVLYYYNGEKLELLGAEHIDCIKDGKDASISDGITIQEITRFYQANSDGTYPDPHEDDITVDGNWKREQKLTNWSASIPYLFIQDYTTYNNESHSWGPVELYSYWGSENYDLIVSPQHIILDEKLVIDKETETITSRNYEGTQTVLLKLYKGSSDTNDNLIYTGFDNTNISFNSISGGSMGTATVPSGKNKSITITIGSITNTTASEGYLDFIVYGYSSSNSDTPVYVKNVRVPVYINRAESKLFSYKGNLKTYIDDQDKVIVLDYNASIEATQKRLTSQFTEHIGPIGSRNFFGFTNTKISNSSYPCVPFIQGYGVVINGSLNSHRGGRVQNLGFNGIGGTYTVSCSMRMSGSTTSVKASLCGKTATTINNNVPTDGKTTVPYNYWQGKTFIFELTDAQAANDYLDFEVEDENTSSTNKIYIRHLKIERGNTATDFCESDEDIIGFLDSRPTKSFKWVNPLLTKTSFSGVNGETCDGYELSINNSIVKDNYLADWNFSKEVNSGDIYTVSFYARTVNANKTLVLRSLLYASYGDNGYSVTTITSPDIYQNSNSGIYEGIGELYSTKTYVYVGTEWKRYDIHFYVNQIYNVNTYNYNVVPLRLEPDDNSGFIGTLQIADVQYQKGYVLPPSSYSSLINQTARRISLAQETGLKRAGIDIYNGRVDVLADNFTITNNNGDVNMAVNEDGDVEFRGVIKGTYGYNIQIYNSKIESTNSEANYIQKSTDFYLYGDTGNYTLHLPPATECLGKRIDIVIGMPHSSEDSVKIVARKADGSSSGGVIRWFTNWETGTNTTQNVGFCRKIVAWANPSIQQDWPDSWIILEADNHLGYDYLISDEATRALILNLNKTGVINALVNVLQGRL